MSNKNVIVDYIVDNYEDLKTRALPIAKKKEQWYKEVSPLLHPEIKQQYIEEIKNIIINEITERHPQVTYEDVITNITDDEFGMLFGEIHE